MIKIISNNEEKQYVDEYYLFFDLLKNKKVDYVKLNDMYVKYLYEENEVYKKQLSEVDMPLIETYKKSKHLSTKNTKDCIVRYLVKYNRFKNAPINNELVKYIKDNNINLEGHYYNDLYNERIGE